MIKWKLAFPCAPLNAFALCLSSDVSGKHRSWATSRLRGVFSAKAGKGSARSTIQEKE